MKWLCPAITSGNPDIERNERRGIASRGDGGPHFRLHLLCVPGVSGKPVDPKYLLNYRLSETSRSRGSGSASHEPEHLKYKPCKWAGKLSWVSLP